MCLQKTWPTGLIPPHNLRQVTSVGRHKGTRPDIKAQHPPVIVMFKLVNLISPLMSKSDSEFPLDLAATPDTNIQMLPIFLINTDPPRSMTTPPPSQKKDIETQALPAPNTFPLTHLFLIFRLMLKVKGGTIHPLTPPPILLQEMKMILEPKWTMQMTLYRESFRHLTPIRPKRHCSKRILNQGISASKNEDPPLISQKILLVID